MPHTQAQRLISSELFLSISALGPPAQPQELIPAGIRLSDRNDVRQKPDAQSTKLPATSSSTRRPPFKYTR